MVLATYDLINQHCCGRSRLLRILLLLHIQFLLCHSLLCFQPTSTTTTRRRIAFQTKLSKEFSSRRIIQLHQALNKQQNSQSTPLETNRVSPPIQPQLRQQGQPEKTTAAPAACDFCQTQFNSRNALFRHLRNEGCSAENPYDPLISKDDSDPMVKQSMAILFGYVPGREKELKEKKHAEHNTRNGNLNEWAGQCVFDALKKCLENDTLKDENDKTINNNSNSNSNSNVQHFRLLNSRTQSSVARLRARILQQDPDVAAAGDVLHISVSCQASKLVALERALSALPSRLEDCILSQEEQLHNYHNNPNIIKVWSVKLLSDDVSLHAERSCTQISYQYLVPLNWLPNGELVKQEWKAWNQTPPTDSLRRFKSALRAAESSMMTATQYHQKNDSNNNEKDSSVKNKNQDNDNDPQQHTKVAAGRFGRLGAKQRQAWHNFADPMLRGQASPNQEPIWRVVDACRMVGVENFGQEDACLVVEVRGDAFLPQQVRRIIGTALAISHGWLPEDIWDDYLLNPSSLTETILAPPGRLYLSGVRFHFEESRTSGQLLFDTDVCGKVLEMTQQEDPIQWTRQQLIKSRLTKKVIQSERHWLNEVKETICPRIRQSLLASESLSNSRVPKESDFATHAPKEYSIVLEKLRNIVKEGRWPATSVARSSVIQHSNTVGQEKKEGKAGSFTVINTEKLDELKINREDIELPLGNLLFPDLSNAIFELEEAIVSQTRKAKETSNGTIVLSEEFAGLRQQSTHCAVNCNAQFTPHVDSGRGAGQSLSIIVGLGDYSGGELMVEGIAFDIRYKALEFDGWTWRHWTNKFKGERFSLVWFTPEMK